jgi:hypothetical protein
LEADKISEAASKPMRQMTVIMLISDTPSEANMLIADAVAVVLSVLVVTNVLVTVLDMAESNPFVLLLCNSHL